MSDLNAARNAMLRLMTCNTSDGARADLSIIDAYLDTQVSTEQYFDYIKSLITESTLSVQASTLQVIIDATPDDARTLNFVFCTGDKDALKPDLGNRRFTTFNPHVHGARSVEGEWVDTEQLTGAEINRAYALTNVAKDCYPNRTSPEDWLIAYNRVGATRSKVLNELIQLGWLMAAPV